MLCVLFWKTIHSASFYFAFRLKDWAMFGNRNSFFKWFISNDKPETVNAGTETTRSTTDDNMREFLILRGMILDTVSHESNFTILVGLLKNAILYIHTGNEAAANLIAMHFQLVKSTLASLQQEKYNPKNELESTIIQDTEELIEEAISEYKANESLCDKVNRINALIMIHPAYLQ